MSSQVSVVPRSNGVDVESLSRVILGGDLSTLKPEQKIQYYNRVCELVGLNPLTKPFDYIRLNGREVLYSNKGCAEQLRMVHKISIKITAREKIEDVYVVTAEASNASGRVDSSTGAVPLGGLKGEALANAMMKAETKAKRRVTLSICGLNMLDETEVESIKAERGGVYPEQPTAEDGDQTETVYKFNFGKYKGRSVEDIYNSNHPNCGPEGLKSYVRFLDEQEQKKPLSAAAIEARRHIEEFLGVVENSSEKES